MAETAQNIDMIIPPVKGRIESAEVTDKGVMYSGWTDDNRRVGIDVNQADMIVNLQGLLILLSGDYLDRGEDHYLLYNKAKGVCVELSIGKEDTFTLRYGHERR